MNDFQDNHLQQQKYPSQKQIDSQQPQNQFEQQPFQAQNVVNPLQQSGVVHQQPFVTYAQTARPLIQSTAVVQQPLQVLQSGVQYVQPALVQQSRQLQVVKGESRIEYVPYEKSYIEYQPVQRVEYVPTEKRVTDYYAVEYQKEYIPQVFQDKYIEYVPQERVQERIEYQAVERKIVHQPVVEQQVVTQPLVQSQVVTAPVVQQYVQPAVATQSLTQSVVYTRPPVVQRSLVNTSVLPGARTVRVGPHFATNYGPRPTYYQTANQVKPNNNLKKKWHTCTQEEKQARICTKEYILHCGQAADGSQKNYANRCNACVAEGVVRIRVGSCEQQETQKLQNEEDGVCTQEDKQVKGCPRIYKPVCGIAGYTVINFNSRCEACQHYLVSRTYEGHCVGGLQMNNDDGECTLQEKQARFCPQIYRPVCGQMGYVTRDFSNRCEACAHQGVSRTWAGNCQH